MTVGSTSGSTVKDAPQSLVAKMRLPCGAKPTLDALAYEPLVAFVAFAVALVAFVAFVAFGRPNCTPHGTVTSSYEACTREGGAARKGHAPQGRAALHPRQGHTLQRVRVGPPCPCLVFARDRQKIPTMDVRQGVTADAGGHGTEAHSPPRPTCAR